MNVLGYSIPDEAEALRLKVGYMTQQFSLYEDLTVLENLGFIADVYTLERQYKKQRLAEVSDRYRLQKILRQRAPATSVPIDANRSAARARSVVCWSSAVCSS